MLYHTAAQEVRDVFDQSSDLALYRTDCGRIERVDSAARADRLETMPEWSPDGRYLYFSSGPRAVQDSYSNVRCDIMRIPYDRSTGDWGHPDTVLTAERAGGSLTQPRISPDGMFMLVTRSRYSDFPIHQARSSLCMAALASAYLTAPAIIMTRGTAGPGTAAGLFCLRSAWTAVSRAHSSVMSVKMGQCINRLSCRNTTPPITNRVFCLIIFRNSLPDPSGACLENLSVLRFQKSTGSVVQRLRLPPRYSTPQAMPNEPKRRFT
jgi:hypothetical protein